MADDFELRAPCPSCGFELGTIVEKTGQDTVRCGRCDRFQYNAPRTETGRAVRSVSTTHAAIKPKQRARILLRDSGRCFLCGATGAMHVGHLVSVEAGHLYSLPDEVINDDENLAAMCPECNLGLGSEPISLRLAITIIRSRIAFAAKKEAS